MIHIVFISDDAYMFATGVAISSIKQSRVRETPYTIHILCDHVTLAKKTKLLQMKENGFDVDIIDVSESIDVSKFFMNGFPVSPSAIYKFKLPEIFSQLDRIIYMDGDLIVQGDLSELWNQDINSVYVAAVSDRHAHFFKRKTLVERIGYPHVDYFNSGVMLLNLDLMRKDGITNKLFEYRLHGRNDFMDQDALNVVLGVKAKFLPLRYNTIATCVRYSDAKYLNKLYPDTHVKNREDACNSAIIYHYASGAKPWKYSNCDYRDAWISVWKKSIYSDEPIANEIFAPQEDLHRAKAKQLAAQPVKVSVIIPVYNAQKYLDECIQSVLNQQGIPEIEVICVDDGSVDNSSFVIYGKQFRDSRVRIIAQENRGAGCARNAALDVAKGKYVLFQDADDKMSGTSVLSEAYAKAESLNLDVLDMEGCEISETGKYLHPIHWLLRKEFLPSEEVFSRQEIKDGLFILTSGGPCAKLFRRSFIEHHKLRFPNLSRSEDFPFVQAAMALANRIGTLQKQILCRRIGIKESLESTKDMTPLAFVDAEIEFEKMMSNKSQYMDVKSAAALMSIVRLDYNLRAMHSVEGMSKVFAYAKQVYPSLIENKIQCNHAFYKEAKQRMDIAMSNPDFDSYLFNRMKLFERRMLDYQSRLKILESLNKDLAKNTKPVDRTRFSEQGTLIELQRKNKEVEELHRSEAYRVGMFVTWPARRICRMMKCYRENGFKYTLRRLLLGKKRSR